MNTQDLPERESWRDIGFIGQAQEYALLILAGLNTLESQKVALPDTAARSAKAASERLDDTSMSLVTDLLLSLTVNDK